MQFTVVDGVVIAVLLLSGLLATSRGFTREVMSIVGWVAAAVAGLYGAPALEPLLLEIPQVGPLLAGSCSLAKLAAFSVAFAVALVLISIFTPLLTSWVRASALGPIDRGLGFLFGVARGVVLVAVLWLVYDLLVAPGDRLAMIEEARSVAMISDAATALQASLPTRVPDWLMRPVDRLMAECGGVDLGPGTETATEAARAATEE